MSWEIALLGPLRQIRGRRSGQQSASHFAAVDGRDGAVRRRLVVSDAGAGRFPCVNTARSNTTAGRHSPGGQSCPARLRFVRVVRTVEVPPGARCPANSHGQLIRSRSMSTGDACVCGCRERECVFNDFHAKNSRGDLLIGNRYQVYLPIVRNFRDRNPVYLTSQGRKSCLLLRRADCAAPWIAGFVPRGLRRRRSTSDSIHAARNENHSKSDSPVVCWKFQYC